MFQNTFYHPMWTKTFKMAIKQEPFELSQLAQRRYDYVVTTSWLTLSQRCGKVEMRVMATSVSNVVTTPLYDVVKTLPQLCNNVTTTTNGCVGAF